MLPKFLNRKLIASFLLFCFISLLSVPSVQAFSTPNDTYQLQFEKAIQLPDMNLQSFVYETLKATVGSVVMTVMGCLSCPPPKVEGVSTGDSLHRDLGLLGMTASLISGIYASPPASGVEYVADVGSRLGIVKPAYAQAQGLGYEKMQVFLKLWQAFRNIAYLFFTIIFVVIGLSIMFRVKISPQAVISIQSALPKLIIALILITFSYAIVGFMIDLMFVITNLVLAVFGTMEPKPVVLIGDYPQKLTDSIHIATSIFLLGLTPILLTFLLLLANPFAFIGILAVPGISAAAIFIAVAIVVIVGFIALARVFWTLLKAYIMIVIALIFSPFVILMGALPGSNSVGGWFKNLLGNLLVLPTVFTMVLLSNYIAEYAFTKTPYGELAKFLKGEGSIGDVLGSFVNIGQIPQILILLGLSIGILLMAPKAADIVQSFLAKKPFDYGSALGSAAAPVTRPVKVITSGIEKGASEVITRQIAPLP